jgi:hypothetical protein
MRTWAEPISQVGHGFSANRHGIIGCMATQASSAHRPGQPAAVRLLVLGAFAVEVDGEPATPPPTVSR